MSDTPKTDAAYMEWETMEEPRDFARELERELAEEKYQHHLTRGVADLAIKHRDEAERENARLREALNRLATMPEYDQDTHIDSVT